MPVSAEGLVVRHGRTEVLALDRLDLAPGRTLALLGPNGAGKSTLLRVLALLERPAAGRLALFGAVVPESDRGRLALRRRLAVVFQEPLLLDRSVAENVALGLRLRGVAGAEVTRRVARWLERFGLGDLAGRDPRSLSGGEARRVSLARAFVVEPELLLLDEPFASLDVHGQQALALELESVLREAQCSTVLVTHDRTEALLLADQALVLMAGRRRQAGPVREVFGAPVDAEVARFLGVENLLPGITGPGADGRRWLRLGGVECPAPAGTARDGPVLVAVRAEDIHFSDQPAGQEAGWLRLEARVRRVVPYGVPFRVELEAAGGPVVALAARRTVDRHQLAAGRPVVISLELRMVHLVAP